MSGHLYETGFLKNVKILREFLSTLKDLFVYGGILPALWGPSLLLASSTLLEGHCSPITALISFMLPLTVYAYDYLADSKVDSLTDPRRSCFSERWGKPIIASCAATLILLLGMCRDPLMATLTVILLVAGVLYTGFFKGFTRRITGFKNIYLGLIWSSWTVIPVAPHALTASHLVVFTFIFLKVYVNTAFSDYKDVESDRLKGLKTLPAVYGENRSSVILQVINATEAVILCAGILLGLVPGIGVAAVILAIYTGLYLHLKGEMDIKVATLIADLEGPLHIILILGSLRVPLTL
ncbi:UbiA family prenyltransferase [Methanothermobacter marburgensis]|uniref:Prenyltransferase-related protein n=1 Tax=Methanothermobacter marburgensis (strain ATCC BAA-927 / DSM 2133 / JCM 14651 / NBRC 100331 / OCM 82 / Marburg) TaxID=79929 RepID=D9PXB2_METTM|nr:UbiA family prenyltransferase [Methanothermobacter marburgensis]ADL58860.1 prenyltransferase-related protein [Methanothermobacter marburgensis str. Marburg]WBF09407.1 UbiA family prenyltransferase [Methanothermobacter marburgensis]